MAGPITSKRISTVSWPAAARESVTNPYAAEGWCTGHTICSGHGLPCPAKACGATPGASTGPVSAAAIRHHPRRPSSRPPLRLGGPALQFPHETRLAHPPLSGQQGVGSLSDPLLQRFQLRLAVEEVRSVNSVTSAFSDHGCLPTIRLATIVLATILLSALPPSLPESVATSLLCAQDRATRRMVTVRRSSIVGQRRPSSWPLRAPFTDLQIPA